MKTSSWKKLLNPHLNLKQSTKDRRKIQPLAQFDELATASEAMQDMRDCYDSLLSAAAAATNSAYEFSESLREMGVCLLQKLALNDDEESGKVLLMLGKVQFELQRLVDGYRNHIFQTITVPSESLTNELQNVEEMKQQCEKKRELYEHMRTKYKEKGRSKSGKGETFSLEQLKQAKEEFDEEATLFVFRLKSLKQGQSRSLLTQAARHHSAQLSFFRKAVKTLEEVDPHVKLMTQQQHIDYQFNGLEDEESDFDDDYGSDEEDYSSTSSLENDDELRYDYQTVGRQLSFVSAARHPREGNVKISRSDSFIRERKTLSQSAPLFPQRKFEPTERIGQLRPSASRKFLSYALPKPGDKSTVFAGTDNQVSQTKLRNPSQSENLYHSSPLEPSTCDKLVGTGNLSGPITLNSRSILKESNNNRIPPPLTESMLQQKPHITPKSKKLQSFSGPLTTEHLSTKPSFSAGTHVISTNIPRFSSGPILRGSTYQPLSSPKTSPTASPTLNPPIISELHELPRPPAHLASGKPSGIAGFSAPLVLRKPESSDTCKILVPKIASPLPTPPQISYFSMPLTDQRTVRKSPHSRPSEASLDSGKSEDFFSPPLTPMMLANQHLA